MAKGISSGIERMVLQASGKATSTPQMTQLHKQRTILKNRLDTILLAGKVLKTTDRRRQCQELDAMTHEKRLEFVQQHWGPIMVQKTVRLLEQIQALEGVIARQAETA
jgi:hypothetical protein